MDRESGRGAERGRHWSRTESNPRGPRRRGRSIAIAIGVCCLIWLAAIGASASSPATAAPANGQADRSGAEQTAAAGADVQLVNCTAARVTGDFRGVTVATVFNAFDGVGTGRFAFDREELPESDGAALVRTSELGMDDGVNGSVLVSVTAVDESGAAIGRATLDGERDVADCHRRARPRIDVWLDGVTEVEPGTYNVTFGYENDHDGGLTVRSTALRGRISGLEEPVPPTELRPGRHAFSVEWAPGNASERLSWQVGFNGSWAGYDRAVVVQTEPAQCYPSEASTSETPAPELGPDAAAPTPLSDVPTPARCATARTMPETTVSASPTAAEGTASDSREHPR